MTAKRPACINGDYEMVPVDRLLPHPRNPRHGDVGAICESIQANQFFGALVVQRSTCHVLAGNHRLLAAKQVGMAEVPVLWVDCDDDRALRILLADNRTNDLAGYNPAALTDLLTELAATPDALAGTGYDGDALDELLADLAPPPSDVDAEPQIDKAEELRKKWGTSTGQLWTLGDHRLLCGDSTDPTAWAALLGDERLQMVWTDPPYGVALNDVASVAEATRLHRRKDFLKIENDALTPVQLREFLHRVLGNVAARCTLGAAWYVSAPSGDISGEFAHVLGREGLAIWRHSLVWVKDRFVLGRADYHYRHETIFYGWIPGGPHYFVDDRTLDTVLDIPRPAQSPEHPTMKPIELVARCIRNSSKEGWTVGEPFSGSGTTIIACEQLGRKCRAIEIDPGYVAVALERWATATGKTPVLDERPA